MNAAGDPRNLQPIIDNIRDHIHTMPFQSSSSLATVKAAKVFEEGALKRIAENDIEGVDLPLDIQLDARALYYRWNRGDVGSDLYRGLKKNLKNTAFHSFSVDPEYKFVDGCKYHGEGALVNGQWFPNQMLACIHGAHGSPDAGICGDVKNGAYSVVVSGGYQNADEGEKLKYWGTEGTEKEPSVRTKYMMESCKSKRPIRVIRSEGLPATNIYRPTKGLRYDGLYLIDDYELREEKTSHYRFNMTRMDGQGPIRYQGPGVSPNRFELRELSR